MGNVKRWPVLAGVGVVVAAAGWWIVDEMPTVDDAVAREALPPIDEHLREWLRATAHSGADVRWVCTQKVIETRADHEQVKIGLVASCDEVERDGDGLVTLGGFRRQPMVYRVERTPGGFRVLDRKVAEDGAGYSPSVKALFSWTGARRVLDGASPDDPRSVSAAAFGLPESTPVRTGR
ncbi:hypothetical protein [Amycolatopsis sp. NPDC049868]|uniref:hypothetical protein n=1 Tax=Amycolatopsis sp. NPDC049868 TaxID=3363934 RepID=UPI0037B0C3CC